jgi:hypothetical protein
MLDDNDDEPERLYCTFCDRRAAKPVAGPPFCIKCIDAGAKRHAERKFSDDPYLRWCAGQVLGISSGFLSITHRG